MSSIELDVVEGLRKPVPIGLCITELNPGGAERALVELATRLNRQQFRPVVYSLGNPPKSDADLLVRRLRDHSVPIRFLNASKWHLLSATVRLRQMLVADHIQLLQTFLFHANIVGAIAGKAAGVVKTVAGIRVAERRRWHHVVHRVATRSVDRHICVSQGVLQHARDVMKLPKDRLVQIPNGVEFQQYSDITPADLSRWNVERGRRVIMYAGRLDQQKGVDWLLELAPQLLSSLQDHDLLLVGAGPLESKLKSKAAELRLGDRVHFVPWQPDLRPLLAASAIFVMPSRWEGMPNVLLEAMASGLPVVATDVEGVREILGPQSSQQVVPFGDSTTFVDLVVEISRNQLLENTLRQSNRERIRSQFTLDHMVKEYERLYSQLLAGLG